MADRSLLVRLRADVGDYVRGMAAAKRATEDVASAGPKAQSSLSRMVDSARSNRREWETTGKVMIGVGAAITGIGVAALNTGIQYNTLQQTSRAALTTLLGTAEAANEQMDELDDFARNSPFAKQVFITAQRQMLGFGIETKRVIPYLDAIQNAVAAMGGSNQDISELSRIISQISASAKITAIDLREFGNRGVDAATIIGSQMGKTGAQIRTDITAGTLDAQDALDALAAGMQERFGGAADNVKSTFLGSLDRVKAAWRDLSSELAAPFVDPNGGGAAVEWLNGIADQMRDFQDLPGPVKATAAGLAAIVAAASLGTGTFLLLAPRLVETYDALGKMGSAGIRAQGALRGAGATLPSFARAAGVATTAILAANVAGQLLASTMSDITLGTNEAEAQMRELASSSVNLENLFGDIQNAWWQQSSPLAGDPLERLRYNLDAIADPNLLQRVQKSISGPLYETTDVARYAQRLEQYGQALSQIAADDLPTAVDAFKALNEAAGGTDDDARQLLQTMPALRDTLVGIAEGAGLGTDDTTLLGIALGNVAVNATDAADGISSTGVALDEIAAKYGRGTDAAIEWWDAVSKGSASFVDLGGAFQTSIDETRAWAEAQAESTKTAKDSWEDYYDGQTVSAESFIESLRAQVTAQQTWQTNMLSLAERVREGMTGSMADAASEMLDELLRLGPEGADEVALLAEMTDEELTQVVELYGQRGQEATDSFNNKMAQLVHPEIILTTSTDVAREEIDRFIRDQSGRTIYLNVAGQQVGFWNGPGTMKGFADGGYTGDGGVLEPAGVVHGREFVVNARATALNRSLLEALNRGASLPRLRGYASGGYVEPRYMTTAATSGSSAASLAGLGAAVAGALDGMHMTLVTEAGPIAAIARAEVAAAQSSRRSAVTQGVRR